MSKSKPVPLITSIDDVQNLTCLNTALKFMMEHGIPIGSWPTLEEVKIQISVYIHGNEKKVRTHNRIKEQSAIADALEEDKRNREELIKLYERSAAFFKDLPARFKDDLERVFPDFQKILKVKSERLKKSDCAIVVAGDTGAGKSTLINLLLGVRILPVDALSCTATICELRSSKDRSVVLHYKQNRQPKRMDCQDDSKITEFLDKITSFVTETDRETEDSPYSKVEIYWPFPMMETGVTIVDTPGIGGSYSLNLGTYLDKALGFIYVINTLDAGGIHRDRLGRLLRQAVEHPDFDPATTIYVCNKWDQVGKNEERNVRDYIKDRLQMCVPAISSTQIYQISANRALGVLDYQKMTDDHIRLRDGIRRVLPITFHSNLLSYYRWLSSVLKRTLYSLKMSKQLDARSVDEKEELYRAVCFQIEQLETQAESRLKEMKRDLKRVVEDTANECMEILKKSTGRHGLTTWASDLCPVPERDWKKLVVSASGQIASRVQDILDKWDRNNDVVARVKVDIINKFKKDVDLFADQAKKIESAFMGEEVKTMVDLHNSMRMRAPVHTVWRRGGKTTSRDFISIGNSVAGAVSLDPKNAKVKSLFKSYDSARAPEVMQEATKMFLQSLNDKTIAASLKKFFDRFSTSIDMISKMLPEFLRADRQLMQTLTQDLSSAENDLVETYPKVISETGQIQGLLDMFFARKLMKFDFTFDELNHSPNDVPIGTGSFANVYYSKITTPYGDTPVALKICKVAVDVTNITDTMLEDNTLRDLDHKNIVKYYGASRQGTDRDFKWVMVLEYCPKTLQQKCVGRNADSPSKHDDIFSLQVRSMKTVAFLAEQICSGLQYLHSKGLVHRDLKPDNILLDDNDIVKLTDVGLAKRVVEIAGTVAGSPVYMAPEVLEPTGKYDEKADIYGLGIILWEMWFGMDAADHIKPQIFGTFERSVKKGLRPSMSLTGKPPDDWKKITVACWSYEATKRPSSRDVRQFFQKFLTSNQ